MATEAEIRGMLASFRRTRDGYAVLRLPPADARTLATMLRHRRCMLLWRGRPIR